MKELPALVDMSASQFLMLAGAGAIISTAGTLLGFLIKDFLITRYFEARKDKKQLGDIYKKYKDPITLACIEFSSRLIEIHASYPTVYLTDKVLNLKDTFLVRNNTEDEHYRKYKLLSTAYRLCAFFGWLELYRQEITFLNSTNDKTNKMLETCLENIRTTFSEGRLNTTEDWDQWNDSLIFKEEQRAIGERMIMIHDKTRSIIGYSQFKTLTEEYIESGKNNWLIPVFNFILNLRTSKDFRKERYFLLLIYLNAFLKTLGGTQSGKIIKRIDTYVKSVQ